LVEYLFPLLDRYPLQAKKKQVYKIFKEVVFMCKRKEHLTDEGFEKILNLRNQIRKMGKKAVNRGNR
jgi:predicted nucleotide-binding protein (sugar kinase/HSP70/actin superfamily)